MAQTVKNPPEMQETWVQSLGWEDPLEEGMVTQSSILAWRIPIDRGAWWATVNGLDTVEQSQRAGHNWATKYTWFVVQRLPQDYWLGDKMQSPLV